MVVYLTCYLKAHHLSDKISELPKYLWNGINGLEEELHTHLLELDNLHIALLELVV